MMIRRCHAHLKAYRLEFKVRLEVPPLDWSLVLGTTDAWIDENLIGFYNIHMSNEKNHKNYEFSFSDYRDAILFKLQFQG